MGYEYTDSSRESNAHSLPDVETFYVGTTNFLREPLNCHICNDWAAEEQTPHSKHIGWYYANLDGGLDCWSGDPSGPYDTEAEALAAAREDAGFCPHGIGDDSEAVCEECPAPELWALTHPIHGTYLYFRNGDYAFTGSIRNATVYGSGDAARDSGPNWSVLRPIRLSDADARRWGR